MERLWAPWRMAYIRQGKVRECIFCVDALPTEDVQNQILRRGDHAFVLLNRYPYNSGHLMVAPYRHVALLADLEPEELHELTRLVRQCECVLREAYRPHGFNIGLNLGEVAGAGFADHLHVHVVPRWMGDTNFMPVIGETKTLPETLEESYNRLLPFFQQEKGRTGHAER